MSEINSLGFTFIDKNNDGVFNPADKESGDKVLYDGKELSGDCYSAEQLSMLGIKPEGLKGLNFDALSCYLEKLEDVYENAGTLDLDKHVDELELLSVNAGLKTFNPDFSEYVRFIVEYRSYKESLNLDSGMQEMIREDVVPTPVFY